MREKNWIKVLKDFFFFEMRWSMHVWRSRKWAGSWRGESKEQHLLEFGRKWKWGHRMIEDGFSRRNETFFLSGNKRCYDSQVISLPLLFLPQMLYSLTKISNKSNPFSMLLKYLVYFPFAEDQKWEWAWCVPEKACRQAWLEKNE